MGDLERLQNANSPPPFFYNDLHDLESLWWIAIWTIFNPSASSEMTLSSADASEGPKQRDIAKNLLFPQSNETVKRSLFLRTNVHYWDYLAWMRFDPLKNALGDIRTALVDKYSKFEASFPDIQIRLFDGTHSLLRVLFRRCRNCTREARSRTDRKSSLCYQPTHPEGSLSKAVQQKLQASASCDRGGRQNPSEACSHSISGSECENCIPKQRERKRVCVDDELSIWPPIRRTR